MGTVEMPSLTLPTSEDCEYYLQTFPNPESYFQAMKKALQDENRFFTDFRFQKLLFWFSKKASKYGITNETLNLKDHLYRARRYKKDKDIEDKSIEFKGYGKEASFVPPVNAFVPDGRGNPSGIIYLYAASDERTAIAEVSPLLETDVSVAEIRLNASLSILNFSSLFSSSLGPDDPKTAWIRNCVLAFTKEFNAPYENKQDYILCQYICEYTKNLGFDGIAFRSSRVKRDFSSPKGTNYIIFNYEKCEAVASTLFYVEDQLYKLKYQDSHGNFKPFEG